MWRLGKTRSWGERRGSRAAALLLLAPVSIWSCGGSSETSVPHAGAGGTAMAGSSSSPTAGKPTTTGGGSAAVAQGGTSGATSAGSGGQATAGAPITQAGAGGSEAVAGAGGAAEEYDPALLGFDCDLARCSVGQACIRCIIGDVGLRKCVPSPSVDPAGFAAATGTCAQPLTVFNECDGPEDCPGARYCVAAESANGFMRCRNEPSSVNGSCCFACGALTDCTLCRSSADCPDNVACVPAQSAPAGIMGCQRPR